VPAPRPRQISDILPRIQNVAQTSQFLVKFALPNSSLRRHLRRKGVNDRFIADDVGLLCSDAVLPGSAMAAINTVGDYQGFVEKFAHTRNFTQINFDFMVDLEYKSMKFLEHWMEYISGGSDADPTSDTYHFQFRYPIDYKSNDTRVVKFERDHNRFLEYRFIGLFPLSINSVKVSYQGSQVLKATATFSYDRYVCGESSSLARSLGKLFNDDSISGFSPESGDTLTYYRNNNLSAAFNQKKGGFPLLNSGQSIFTPNDFRNFATTFDPDGFISEGRRI